MNSKDILVKAEGYAQSGQHFVLGRHHKADPANTNAPRGYKKGSSEFATMEAGDLALVNSFIDDHRANEHCLNQNQWKIGECHTILSLTKCQPMTVAVKEIEAEGGTVSLNECKVTFPNGTFCQPTKVWMTVEVGEDGDSEWSKEYIGISPVFDINAESPLLKDATVQLKSWCTNLQKDDIVVLHFSNNSDWNIIKPNEVTNDGTIHFQSKTFSPVLAAIKWLLFGTQEILCENCLYVKNNRFYFAIFKNSMTVYDIVRSQFNDMKAERADIVLPQVNLKIGDRFHVKLEILNGPQNLQFNKPEGHTFVIDKEFLKKQRHEAVFWLPPDFPECPGVTIKCTMKINGEEVEIQPPSFTFSPEGDRPEPQATTFHIHGPIYRDLHLQGRGNQHQNQQIQRKQHSEEDENK